MGEGRERIDADRLPRAPFSRRRGLTSATVPVLSAPRPQIKAEYLKNHGPEKFKLKMRQGRPKKPPTAYFHFLAHMRKVLMDGPDKLDVKEVSKRAGKKWRSLTPEEKEPFERRAAEAKAMYDNILKMPPEEQVEHLLNASENYYAGM